MRGGCSGKCLSVSEMRTTKIFFIFLSLAHGRAPHWLQRGMKAVCDSGILLMSRGH